MIATGLPSIVVVEPQEVAGYSLPWWGVPAARTREATMTPLLLSNFVRRSRCFYSVDRGATSNVAVESFGKVFCNSFSDRQILFFREIAENMASKVVDSMVKMQIKNVERPISLLISPDGGEVLTTFSILEIMKLYSCPIYIFFLGQAGSMASLVLATGTPDHRYSLPTFRIMIHKPYLTEKTSKQALTKAESSDPESIKPASLESSDDVMILNEKHETIWKMVSNVYTNLTKHTVVKSIVGR
ncbi:ATP-dependent Clp protease proteolytic subunit-like [Zingiber officinale]|uniref:ATP-dependent Clp protease proteolytic subunit-like n=1 Tax=Zingiber officinale TaxID=94328 RepID=UPI001C4DB646|nr:ATP-dependent Clp protease proteolytic subunit-like [Zingiber officinale]